ncbi:MAG: translocation/assembly module TamB [Chlorobium sp.]|nr:translocation/assembly module TamB [Chlorobium sp.]
MERIKHYILRLLTVVSAVTLLLSLSVMIVLNSGLLDLLVKDRIIKLFGEKFFGRVELQELHLKFPNNVLLIHPRIYGIGEKTPALEARSISIKINIFSLLRPDFRSLYLPLLKADYLNTRIIQQKNGKLNLERIFNRRDADSTKTLLDHFFCKSMQINNSTISYSGNSTHPDSGQFSIKNIKLELSEFTFKKKLVKGKLARLQLNIPQRNISLQEASGQFLFSETRSEVLSLKVKSNKSHAELSATLDHFNIFSRERQKELNLSNSFLNIQEISLDIDDMKRFYPKLEIPAGLYTLKGNVRGKMDDIEIIDALLTHAESKIAIKGNLLNPQSSNAFAYDLKCDSSKIALPFIESYLKERTQTEVARKTGDITFLGTAKGTLEAVKTDVTILSAVGDVSLSGEISRKEAGQFGSNGTIELKNVKPHTFIDAGNKKSLINASGSFEARASNNELSHLKLDMKLKDSFWHNQQLQEGTVSALYSNKLLKSALFLKNNQTSFALDSEIDWANELPRYRASGKAVKLNLLTIIDSKDLTTDLNGVFSLQGSGFNPRMLNIAASIQFSPSLINGFELTEQSKASLEIVQNATSSLAKISSDFIDVIAEGDYSFEELIHAGQFASSGVMREISAQNIWPTTVAAPLTSENTLKRPITINYRINVKDISPLVLLWPVQKFALQGRAEGRVAYKNGQCSINTLIDLSSLHAHNDFFLKKLSMELGLDCNSLGIPQASVSGKVESITVAGKNIGNALFSGIYSTAHLEAAVDLAIPDPAQSLSVKFTATKNNNNYEILFKHLSLKDASGIWLTADNSNVMVGKTSAKFNNFTITKGLQQAIFDGELSNSLPGNFLCTLNNFDINELNRFAPNPSLEKISGRINASLMVSGEPGSKKSSFNITGEKIRYDKLTIGEVKGSGIHNGNQLRFDIHSSGPLSETSSEKSVTAISTIDGEGTIPVVISYFPLQLNVTEQQPINASFRSDNLSAKFIELLFPIVTSVEGIIPTTLQIQGRMSKPDISMTSRLRNTKIKIEPTQVSYLLNGDALVTPNGIELREITISDNVQGSGVINGVVMLEKLKPSALSLTAKTEKLLLFNKKDNQDETSFGSITGTTNNIRVHGKLSAPVVEGEMRIDAADFSLYRSGANESAKYVGADKFIEIMPRYNKVVTAKNSGNNITQAKPAEFYHSLIDILQIQELKLSSVEPLKYTMIFDSNRGEQLETSINNLSLIVNKNNQQYRLFGSVNIIDGKYKFSNSNFDLQDGGTITWNNVDIRSGIMDNLYGSKYVNASNQQNGDRDQVNMLLAITGSLNNPQVTMGYYLNEQTQPYASVNMIGKYASQIDPNAELNVISMLLAKQWYARPGTSGQLTNIAVSSAGFSAGTGILSSRISRVIQDIGGLESFNVNVGVNNSGTLSGLDLYFALSVPGTKGKVRFIGTGSSTDLGGAALSDYYGTAQKIEYRITPKVYFEASRSFGQNGITTYSSNLQKPAETLGISLSYKERFHSWEEFWKRIIPSSDKKR